jgi:hypothetical protein
MNSIKKTKKTLLFLTLTLLVAGLGQGCVVATIPQQPADPVVVVPVRPHPKAVWVKGHWVWKRWQHRYAWVPGHWAVRRGGRLIIIR